MLGYGADEVRVYDWNDFFFGVCWMVGCMVDLVGWIWVLFRSLQLRHGGSLVPCVWYQFYYFHDLYTFMP